MNEEELIYTYEELSDLVLKYQELYIKEKNNINKAIEYIKDNDLYTYIPDNDLGMDYNELVNEKLLDILKDDKK